MVKIEIQNCEQCPHHTTRKVYTDDSWDNVRAIECKLLQKEVHSYLDWYDEATIPTICPFNQKEFSDSLTETKWITVDHLKELVQRKDKLYNEGKTSLGSPPIPLFNYNLGSFDLNNNDEFNPDNWCGGDDIIREYTTLTKPICKYDLETDKIGFRFISNHTWIEDYQLVSIVVDYYELSLETDEWKTDSYLIKIYKNRGRTEKILRNGQDITLGEYVDLLNIIKATGFEFTDIKE